MCENSEALIKRLSELNTRLSNEVLFANKCLSLLVKYRNILTLICLNCNCNDNMVYKSKVNDLEDEYKCVFDVKNDCEKQLINETNDNQSEEVMNNTALSHITTDGSKLNDNQNKLNYY
jgi:hypothetical protein